MSSVQLIEDLQCPARVRARARALIEGSAEGIQPGVSAEGIQPAHVAAVVWMREMSMYDTCYFD